MDTEQIKTLRRVSPQRLSLTDGEKTTGLVAAWWWLPAFLARMLMGLVFIQTGWNQLYVLNPAKDALGFLWVAIFIKHRWDAVFPALELIFGALMLLGLFTRFTALLLLGLLAISILDANLRELTGLNLSGLQNFAMIALLVGLCASGGGSASLDRFAFKCKAPETY